MEDNCLSRCAGLCHPAMRAVLVRCSLPWASFPAPRTPPGWSQAFSWAPWVTERLPAGSPCGSCWCVHVNATFPVRPSLHFPRWVQVWSPHPSAFLLCKWGPQQYLSRFRMHIHIYVSIWRWLFAFWLTSVYITGSSFIQLTRMDTNLFLFMAEWYSIVSQCLYPFIFRWTSRFLQCPGCCKQRCHEYCGACVLWNAAFSGYMLSSGMEGSYESFIPIF